MALLLIVAGLLLLVFGGDALVRGAVGASLRLGIPALIVSLTIVAFGTSAPELVIVIQAAFDGVPQLALGNIIGSNIANILLILGLPAVVFSIAAGGADTRRDFGMMIAASVLFIGLLYAMPFGPLTGVILLTVIAGIIAWTIKRGLASKAEAEALSADVEETHDPLWKSALFILGGLIALPLGAKFLVDGAITVAERFGVSEAVIGLTIVAVGTSLPELAATMAAGFRKQADVAIGNVLGSNMFNLLVIGGVAALFGPVSIDPQFLRLDVWVMLGASLLLVPYIFLKADLSRVWGLAFCLAYGAYMFAIL